MSTTAKIAAKGTTGTGITEELAKRCHDQLGRKVVAVVELVAESRSEKRSGDESVSLSILTLEPAPNKMTEDHLRELARSFHYERQLEEQGPTLDGGEEPSVDQVLAAGAKYKPHPYLASTLSLDDDAICDVCGQVESTAVHADRAGLQDPFAVTEADLDEADDDGTDTYSEPHDFEQGPDDACICGAPYGNPIHDVDVSAADEDFDGEEPDDAA